MSELFELKVSGEKIIGTFHRGDDSDTCLIMVHGLLSNKDSLKYVTLGKICEQLGRNALRFDFRGCGESEGRIEQTTVTKRITDLKTVINALTQKFGFDRFGLFGSSLGGYLSLLHTSNNSDVGATVCISTPYAISELVAEDDFKLGYYEIDGYKLEKTFFADLKQFDLQLHKGLPKIVNPVLLFQGDIDTLVPISNSTKIYNSLTCVKDIRILKGAAHLIVDPGHLKDIIENSLNWFDKYLWRGG
jgi:pimeloyl-ACP methyl ester carboxylesterase